MNSKKIAIISTLAALSIATNYAMLSLPNVKLMDLIVFVSGFCFGPVVGALTGIISWAVYGTLNPMGFSLHIWFATMFSESIYGVAGAIMRKGIDPRELGGFRNPRPNVGIFFGLLSFFLTFTYDLITNVVYGYVSNLNILIAVVGGFVTLGLVHMISNAFFFSLGCAPAISALLKVVGGEDSVILKK